MNVSCPNIKAGGIEFGTDPARAARSGARLPRGHQEAALDQADAQHARTSWRWRAPAPTAAPTGCRSSTPSRAWRSTRARGGRRSRPSSAACPGPAIKPIALRMVYQVHRAGVPAADLGHRRHPGRHRRDRVLPRRRQHRAGRHAELRRPQRSNAHSKPSFCVSSMRSVSVTSRYSVWGCRRRCSRPRRYSRRPPK